MKTYVINAIVALLLIIGVVSVQPTAVPAPQQSNDLAGLSERDIQAVSLKVGPRGEKVSSLDWGTCNLQPDAATIAGSSTARVTCHGGSFATGVSAHTVLSGITSASKVVATLSSTTAAAGRSIGLSYGGLTLMGVTASTTSTTNGGFLEVLIGNQTGATYTWPLTGTASGTMQFIAPR